MTKTNRFVHTNISTIEDPRWKAFVSRDPAAVGQFYTAVKTTGIYCLPTCSARLPKPENILFFDTIQAAEQAGFRPCKRCKPDQIEQENKNIALITKICRILEVEEEIPSLDQLAASAGMSKYHFHRLFKKTTGLTPREYAVTRREARLRENITQKNTITEAIYDAGYNANSRFYEKSDQVLGMTPSTYRSGGKDMKIHFAIAESSLGLILVAESERGLCSIMLGDEPDKLMQDLHNRFPKAELVGGDSDFENRVAMVIRFIESPKIGLDLPLDIQGTAFQQRVWQALRLIPAGTTASYAEIAERVGSPKGARAVAQACASNYLAVAIPCHRVVHNDGSISGYRWGVGRKKALLQRESEEA
ncbi:MAG: bifunctional DNA-binding transcriptional regulator/O6-methylguanine-DNA methyltransferase Ada [Anaerolineaceae bacterium]